METPLQPERFKQSTKHICTQLLLCVLLLSSLLECAYTSESESESDAHTGGHTHSRDSVSVRDRVGDTVSVTDGDGHPPSFSGQAPENGYCEAGSDNCPGPATARNDQRGRGYVYRQTRPSETGLIPEFDPHGYVFFCPCMGRLGNQIDHFLGGLAFAKSLNRTLVVPPLRTYRNVRFTEWFQFEPLLNYHRVVLAEDFMEYIAPHHWPPGKRIGFCWLAENSRKKECNMKYGNPFKSFWDGLKIDFDDYRVHHLSYHHNCDAWHDWFPASRYPVLAFKGAPAHFPIWSRHRHLQQLLVFSDRIEDEALNYINTNFPGQKFIGIHLRNGADWVNACQGVDGVPSYMASPQCLENTDQKVTKQLCFPSKEEVLRLTEEVVIKTGIQVIFVAADKNPMIQDLEIRLNSYGVKVHHMDPHLPVIDLAILSKSDHFIGNCVSSFTAFVKRARDIAGKPSAFWGFS